MKQITKQIDDMYSIFKDAVDIGLWPDVFKDILEWDKIRNELNDALDLDKMIKREQDEEK